MNEDLKPRKASAEERVASFARAANVLAAITRAGARVGPAAAIRARANALAEALRAFEVPARAAPARGSADDADALDPHESGSSPRDARPLAAVLAAGRARLAPVASRRIARSSAKDERRGQRPSSPRAAMTRALAAARTGGVALGRIQQFTLHANLQSGAQELGRAADDSAFPEAARSSAPAHSQNFNIAAMLTAAGAARRTGAGKGQVATAPGAPSSAHGNHDARRAPSARAAIAVLPTRIHRMLASSRAAAPPNDEFSLRGDIANQSRERGREFGAVGGRRSASAAAPITINSSPSITVNLPTGAAASGEREISRAVAQALEEHAEKLYELMRSVGAFRERTEF